MNTTALYVIPRGLPCIQGVEVNPHLLIFDKIKGKLLDAALHIRYLLDAASDI
jgi:hypothetical protein